MDDNRQIGQRLQFGSVNADEIMDDDEVEQELANLAIDNSNGEYNLF